MTNTTRILLLVAGGLVLWQVVRGARVYAFERQFYLPSNHRVPRPADAVALGLRDVTFQSHTGARLSGWYVPSRNRAAIILTHGSGGDRTNCLADARILLGAGFGVLLFDWPGHGESEGQVTWGSSERAALTAAIDFVAAQPDVDPQRIGVDGFSAGGYFAAQVAAMDTRLRAVVLVATPTDIVEQTRTEYARSGHAAQIGALLALRLHVTHARAMRPLDIVRSIAPRPVLVVGGSHDRVVPPAMTRQLFDAAGEPKSLLIVDGAAHGDYETKSEGEYGRRLVRFFESALLDAPADTGKAPEPAARPATSNP